MAGTPGSSPASSIDFSAQGSQKPTPKYGLNGYSKPRSASSSRPPPLSSANKRTSLMPHQRRPTTPLSAHSSSALPRRGVSPAPGPPSVYRQGLYIPPSNPVSRPAPTPLVNKPRWSSTVRPSADASGHKSASTTTPGPYKKYWTPRSISSTTALPLRSPLGRETSASPSPVTLPTPITVEKDHQQYRSFAERIADPSPTRPGNLLDPVPYHRSRNVSAPQPGLIRSPSSMAMHNGNPKPTLASTIPRPPSSLNRGPRASLPPRVSSLNARVESKPQHAREPSLPHSDLDDQENRSQFSNDLDEDFEKAKIKSQILALHLYRERRSPGLAVRWLVHVESE